MESTEEFFWLIQFRHQVVITEEPDAAVARPAMSRGAALFERGETAATVQDGPTVESKDLALAMGSVQLLQRHEYLGKTGRMTQLHGACCKLPLPPATRASH